LRAAGKPKRTAANTNIEATSATAAKKSAAKATAKAQACAKPTALEQSSTALEPGKLARVPFDLPAVAVFADNDAAAI
jgi:hypothetical protein